MDSGSDPLVAYAELIGSIIDFWTRPAVEIARCVFIGNFDLSVVMFMPRNRDNVD